MSNFLSVKLQNDFATIVSGKKERILEQTHMHRKLLTHAIILSDTVANRQFEVVSADELSVKNGLVTKRRSYWTLSDAFAEYRRRLKLA